MLHAFAQVDGLPGGDQCSGGVEQHDIAPRAGFAVEEAGDEGGILGGIAAGQLIEAGFRYSHLGGGKAARKYFTVAQLAHPGLSDGAPFIDSDQPMHDEGARRTEQAQHARQRLGESGS